jgi:DNA-binding CsgD family transcriptional regulator
MQHAKLHQTLGNEGSSMNEPLLSERELDIMRQVVTGASNREIAQSLDISHNTVKVHLRNIFEKLGVASRTEATLYVLRQGWVHVDGKVLAGGGTTGANDTIAPLPEFEEEEIVDRVEDTDEALELDNFVDDGVLGENGNALLVTTPVLENAKEAVIVHKPPVLVETGTLGAPPLVQGNRIPAWLLPVLGVAIGVLLTLVVVLFLQTLQPEPPATTPIVVQEPARWEQLTVLPSPRSGVMAAKVGRDVLMVGGTIDEALTDEVWLLENTTNTWQPRAPLPQPVRYGASALAGGQFYVAGGEDESGNSFALVQRYDPQADVWSEMPALPQPVARGALIAFEGTLYYCGGTDGSAIQSTIYRLAPNGDEWEEAGTLPDPRADLAAVAVNDGILLFGGVNADERPVNDVLHYSPNSAEPFREENPLPAPDSQPRAVTLGSAVYLLGIQGFLEQTPNQPWKAAGVPDTPLPTDSALVVSDPYILVIGGQRGDSAVDEIWQYEAIYRSFIPIVPNQRGADNTGP